MTPFVLKIRERHLFCANGAKVYQKEISGKSIVKWAFAATRDL